MSYTLIPSLEDMTCLKIATILWNQDDIGALAESLRFTCSDGEKCPIKDHEVIKKVAQLSLPEIVKKKIITFIKPIGEEILKWLKFNNQKPCLRGFLPNNLCWTPQGTIDLKKTAEGLIEDEWLHITSRYELACIYCLENDIPKLWSKIRKHRQKHYSKDPDSLPNFISLKFQEDIVFFWTCKIKGEVARMHHFIERKGKHGWSFYKYAFVYAAANDNRGAAEYFLPRLTPKERKESLVEAMSFVARYCNTINSGLPYNLVSLTGHYADTFCFLLLEMDEEQQIEVFKSYPYLVLKCFLDWPWQSFFMEMTNRMWDFLSKEDFSSLLKVIIKKVSNGYEDCDYQMFFGELWQQSPDAYKIYAGGCALVGLYRIKDVKNIKLILNDLTLIEKKYHLNFSFSEQFFCRYLIEGDESDLLKWFIQECISSKSEMMEFKKKIMKNSEWASKLCHFIDDLIQKDGN